MKRLFVATCICAAGLALAAGCQKEDVGEIPAEGSGSGGTAQGTREASDAGMAAPPAGASLTGTVVETMTTAGYTYVLVDSGTEKIWAAAPAFEVQEGDQVSVPPGAPMTDYYSKSLDRTFDVVYFVPAIGGGGGAPAAGAAPEMPAAGHPPTTVEAGDVSLEGIEKAEDGLTVEELFRGGSELAGTTVAVRGKVVKFSPQIMGKNWLHLQDGTDHEGANDLTVTTGAQAQKGDIVVVRGVVTVDKDFGAGYRYDLIIEDADVSVE